MSHSLDTSTSFPAVTIGLDLGDRHSQLYAVDAAGQCLEERTLPITAAGLDAVCAARTQLINHVRGAVKSMGARLPASAAEAFVLRAGPALPPAVAAVLAPLLTTITVLTQTIAQYDAQVATLIRTQYPVAQRLQQPAGVGPLTALAFVLLVDTPERFASSRAVGAYFGLVPRLDERSAQTPQLRITKAGDGLGRRLLVSAAHYILGPFGPPCDLRRAGEALMLRGGANAKKRAVIAVARKLAKRSDIASPECG